MHAAARMNAGWDGPWSKGPKRACTPWARERLPSTGRMWSFTITSRGGKMLSTLWTMSSAGDSAAGAGGQGAWALGQASAQEDVREAPLAEDAQLRMWNKKKSSAEETR